MKLIVGGPIGFLFIALFAIYMIPKRIRQIRTSKSWFEKIGLSIALLIYVTFFFMVISFIFIIFGII